MRMKVENNSVFKIKCRLHYTPTHTNQPAEISTEIFSLNVVADIRYSTSPIDGGKAVSVHKNRLV